VRLGPQRHYKPWRHREERPRSYSRKPEDGLLQSLRSQWRDRRLSAVSIALCLALCFTAFVPLVLAQTPATSSASGEARLRLADEQGNADSAILDWVLANSGPLRGDTHAGTMRIAFTITPAEGWWDKAGGGKLAWHEAPAGNVHLRIFVADLADGRLIPGLTVRATLIDFNGNEQSAPADFGWYPLINAYGGNVPIVADSSYTLRVAVDGPTPHHLVSFGEHSEHTTIAEFPPVAIKQPIAQLTAQPTAEPTVQPTAQDAGSQLPPAAPLATASASAHEAELLKPCNAALTAAITALWQQSVSGAERPDDDYFVAYALTFPGTGIPLAGSKLHFKGLTGKEDVRLELLVRDSRTGRIIPGIKPRASLIDADGESYGPGELSLTLYSWLTHYGGDARLPRKGLYTLRVHFAAPGFRRWGRQSERFGVPAEAKFENISLKPETKD
jgi:hypothetical protein